MASGFQANASVLQALFDRSVLGAEPLVFSDRLNHASIHFGCAASAAREVRYRHCDAAHLGSLLSQYQGDERPSASGIPPFESQWALANEVGSKGMAFQVVELKLDADDNVIERKVVPYPYATHAEAVETIESLVSRSLQSGYDVDGQFWWAATNDGKSRVRFLIEQI